ncbi:MAG: ferrous iron transport protein B [Bacteroidaceae bacterium]|nr:ferrous iron transport protein B [Bacteroidaceae bacterium]
MRLSELKTGEKGVVVKVLGHGGFRKRIVEMGFIKGKTVEVLLNAPLNDPIKYKILGYEISLRRQEAEMIEVVSEEEARQSVHCEASCQPLTEVEQVDEASLRALAKGKRHTINVALVGNPNCGKTSLFNVASGAHEHVGNYSGVTVDAKEGRFEFQGYSFKLVDLPGTYSLSAYSPEERYVRQYLVDETPDVVINVVDASNLERNLYLTTQLIDMNVRMIVALNMYDELEASGNMLDYKQLGTLLGVPMVPTVSRTGKGLDHLFHTIISMYEGGDFFDRKGTLNDEALQDLSDWHRLHVTDHLFDGASLKREHPAGFYRHIHINHGAEIEQSIDAVKHVISANEAIRSKYSTRFLAIKLLEGDEEFEQLASRLPNGEAVLAVRDKELARLQAELNEDGEAAITDAKYGFIQGALRETFTDNHQDRRRLTAAIDAVVTHRLWGFPIFFLFLYVMFECTFVLGEYPMMGIEWLVALLGDFIQRFMSEGMLKDMLVDGVIGGVGGVIVFLPNILILYLFISVMEDSGYMARAAFIMDKLMHKMGLHGKSFIPLIMGFGCNVPAIMASRTIESRKSRLITMLVNPLMSCSARLPVYLLLVGAFFPHHASAVLLSIYAVGILLAVVMARLFSKLFMKDDDTPFVMELPPYRLPTAKSIFRHTWEKGAQYLKKMGGIIMVASVIIWFLGYFPLQQEGETLASQQERSYIGRIGQAIEPVIAPLGFDWKLGIGLVSGVGAKELVVSTIGVLYHESDEAVSAATEGEKSTLSLRIAQTITPLAAVSYMLFVLIYFPCVATLAAIKQESGKWMWALFTALYTTLLAWLVSFAVYQIGSLFL